MGIYMEHLATAVAAQLRAERSVVDMQVKDLAAATGMGVNTISRYLNNKTPIPMDSFAAMCEALGQSPSDVMRRAMERIPQG